MKTLRNITKTKSFSFINEIHRSFPESEIFFVGGTVRDDIISRRIKDFDIVIRGLAPAQLEKILAKFGSVELVGKRFGVYKFKPKDHDFDVPIDIALPRTEVAGGSGAYTDFKVETDYTLPIEEDLGRRDFTFNAMAWNVREAILIDPYGGMKDLEDKRVRAVGNPDTRFKEDYSRMLRGLRFAIQLGCSIENDTWESLKSLMRAKNLRVIPEEVTGKEFLKSLLVDPVRTLELWNEAGALQLIIPELIEWDTKALESLGSAEFEKFFGKKKSAEVVLAVLLYPLGAKLAGDIVHRLKLYASGFVVSEQRVKWLVNHYEYPYSNNPKVVKASELQRMMFNPSYIGKDLLKVSWAITGGAYTKTYLETRQIEPILNGEQIMASLKLKPGPTVGKILDHLIDLQGSGKLSNSARAEKYLKERTHDKAFFDSL